MKKDLVKQYWYERYRLSRMFKNINENYNFHYNKFNWSDFSEEEYTKLINITNIWIKNREKWYEEIVKLTNKYDGLINDYYFKWKNIRIRENSMKKNKRIINYESTFTFKN